LQVIELYQESQFPISQENRVRTERLNMDNWQIKLKSDFVDEALRVVLDIEKNFLELTMDSSNADGIDQIFRLAHKLKGSAKAVGFRHLGEFTNEIESVLLKIRTKELFLNKPIVNLLLLCKDHLRIFVDTLKANPAAEVDSKDLIREIHLALAGGLEEAVDEVLSSELAVAATFDARENISPQSKI